MNQTSQQVNDKVKREMQMYGMCDFDIREQYIESLTARLSGLEMVVAGILSDAQELLSMLPTEDALDEDRSDMIRQQLNVAKFILFEMMESKREKETV